MRPEDDISEFTYLRGGRFTPPLYHAATARTFNDHHKSLRGAQHLPMSIISPDIVFVRFSSLQCSGYEQDRVRLCDPTDELLAELSESNTDGFREVVHEGTHIYLPRFKYRPSNESLRLMSYSLDAPEIERVGRDKSLDDVKFLSPDYNPT